VANKVEYYKGIRFDFYDTIPRVKKTNRNKKPSDLRNTDKRGRKLKHRRLK